MIVEDFGFYWGHYLLHLPALYKRFHKQHHEYTSPFSVTAEYAHLMEYIFGNLVKLLQKNIKMNSFCDYANI